MNEKQGFEPTNTPGTDTWGAAPKSMGNSGAIPDAISDAEALDALKVLEERRKDRRKKRIIKIAVAAVVAAAVVAGVYFFTQQGQAAEQTTESSIETDVVVREDYSVPISGSGTLRAATSASVTPEVEGTVTEVFVEEGQHVEKGDRLFAMESPEIENAIKEAQEKINEADRAVAKADAALSAAQSAYNKANKAYKAVKKKRDAAENEYTSAMKKYNKYVPDAKKKQQSKYNSEIKLNVKDADNPTAAEIEAAEKEAQKAYDEYMKSKGFDKKPTNGASKYDDKLAEAEEARDAAQGEVDAAKEELSSAQSDVESAQTDYNEAVADRDKCTVTAPQAGTLVSFSAKVGDTTGSSEGSADSIARIADLSHMKIIIEVSESDIANIEKGQSATIKPSAFEDVELTGKVTSIASSATGDDDSGGFDGGSVTFGVEIEIDKPDGRLKPGMSASASILTQEIKDALIVPTAALSEEDDGTYVQVVVNEETMETESKKVTVKTQDSERAVIKKGLSEGDVVVVSRVDFAAEYDEGMADDEAAGADEDVVALDKDDEELIDDEEDLDLESDSEE